MRWPFLTVLVAGASMVPTLRDGDAVLVRRGGKVAPGDVVLARFRSQPDLLVVKRAVEKRDNGWWLASDNTFAGGDSARFGVADPVGRVLCRYWPPVRWLSRNC